MAKQLNVDLRFTANNAQAKQQIQDLQIALDKLMTTSSKSSSGLGITKDIAQATNEVAKLQAMLESSKNTSGGLDLGKFNQALAQGQIKISDYAKTLSSLGPQGDQAFAKLAKAIISAEVPLKRTNGLLQEFKTSLANTARWQLSSSVLHGFMGAVQSAYGYAQDLNESLNNIRIVTGQNIEQMTAFAKEANKAAQALSTTTTEYTDASLIYYQQGLSDSEVAKRTEVTIKMANAAGQSAKVVSDQLTAVWNNFYDGSKSLEYYADVMTALGATTASSVDEIAGGLEKFAAIGETIGLSYEYAASALATITSNTRQSEEVVGTALKTIFARIQGLNLGETLDDGTSLNKYSEALEKVGISIFEQNGEIKKMDNILDEIAAKWGILAKDQQIALAQTVAGVRQYTQLIALMDNWNAEDSDSMVANLDTAYNATGALQEQADIYAESWEAARDRVTAAAEEIYNQLLNDKFFIALNNGFAGFLNIVSNTIDTLGGLPGVLTLASSIMFRMFGKDMAKAIDDWGYNIKLRSSEGVQEILKLRQESAEALKNVYADNVDTGPVNATSQASFESQAAIADTLLVKRQQLLANGQALSEQDERQAQLLLKINEAYGEQAIESAHALENIQKQSDLLESQARTQIRRYNKGKQDDEKIDLKAEINEIKQAQIQYSALESTLNKLSRAKGNFKSGDDMIAALKAMADEATNAGMDVSGFHQILSKLSSGMSVDEVLNTIETEMHEIGDAAYEAIEGSEGLRVKLQQIGMSDQQINKLIESWEKQGVITSEVAEKLRNVKVQGDEANAAINKMKGPPPTVGQKFMAVANTISNIAMSINAVKGLIDTWNNDDMSFGEKLLSTFTTLGMVIPMVTTALTGNNLALLGSVSSSIVAAAGFKGVDIAAKMAAGGVGALWAALWPIALIMGAVTLVAWGLYAAFKSIEENSLEGQLKQTKEEAKELNDALLEATQAAEELKSAFDGYDSAVEALENCTEGTQEWYNALRDVNNEVLSLLSSYPDLASMVNEKGEKAITKGKDGEFVVADWAKKQLTDQANQAILNTQVASSIANRNVRDAELKVQRSELASSINNKSGTTALKTTYQGEAIDVSSMVSAYIAENAEALSSMTTDQQTDALKSYFESNDISANVDSWVSAITDLGPEFGQLASAVEANTAATQLENEILANEILAENKAVQESDYTDQITSVVSHDLDKLVNSKEQELIDSGWGTKGISKATGVNDEARKIFAEYAEAADITNYDLTDTTGTDANRAFVYTDENNESVTVTLDAMRAVVAAAEANTEVANNATNLVEAFSNKTESEVAEMTAAVTQDVKDLTVAQTQEGYEVTQLSSEDLEALGFGSQAEYEEAFNQLAEGASSALSDIIDDYVQSVQDSMNALKDSGALNDLTLEEVDALGSTMEEVFSVGGQAALDNFTNIFESIDATERDEFVNALSSIDWQTTNVDNLRQKLTEAGVEVSNLDNNALQSLIDTMKSGSMSIETATAKYNSLNEIINGLNTGDTISEDQFNKFSEYGIAADDYFMRMADGTYKLIGDAEEFYNIVNNEILEDFKQNIQNAQESNNQIDNLKNYDSTSDFDSGAQVDFLELTSGADQAQIAQWRKELTEGAIADQQALTDVVLEHIETLGGEEAALDSLNQKQTENNNIIRNSSSSILSTAQSLGEFKNLIQTINDALGDEELSYQQQAEGLIALGSQYDNCEEEIKEFQAVLNDTNGDLKDQKRVALEAAIAVGEAAEQYGFAEDEIEDLADGFQDLAKTGKNQYKILGEDGEAAADAAIRYKRLNDAVLNISENYDDYTDVLKDVRDATDDLDKAMIANSKSGKSLQSALAGLLGTSTDLIDVNLLEKIDPKDFEAAAEGDEAAIQRIRDAFIELQAEANNIDVSGLKEELAGLEEGIIVDINADTMPFLYALIEAQLAAGATAADIESLLSGFNIDATITDFQGTLAEAVAASKSASAEIIANNSYTQDVKQTTVDTPVVDEEIQYETQYTPHQVDSYDLVLKNGADEPELVHQTRTEWTKSVTPTVVPTTITDQEVGTEVTTSNAAGDSAPVKGVKIENAHKSSGGKVSNSTKKQAGNNMSGGGKKGGGGGGGGSKSNPAKPTKKSDVVQRYKEVEDKLDDIREEADKTRDSLDKLYGAEHEAAIQRLLKLEQQEIDLLKEKQQEAKNYLREDLKELKKVSAEVDVEFKFDDKGNIKNYEEEMTELYEELAAIERKAGDEWDENEQKEIDALKEKIDKLEEAMDAYEETRELLEDINAELDAFKGKPALPLITSDSLDIYWEINDALDDIDEKIKDLERKAESLTGEDKIKALEEINRLEQERVAILQQQAEINRKDIEEKRAALDELARLNGLEFEYDENGNITNYQEQLGILQNQLDELYEKQTKDGFLSPADEEAVNAIVDKMQELEEHAENYRDAVEESEDILNEIEDTLSGIVADPFVRSDHMDIYKETNDQLDDIDRKIEKAQREADRLTGEARTKKLNEIITLERQRVKILEKQAEIAKADMEDRKAAMEEIAARQDLMFEYDENGNITNYIEQLDVLVDKYEKAYDEALSDDGLIDATEQAILDAIEEDIDHLEEYIDAYCEAVETMEDIENEREDIATGGYVDISQLDEIGDELHDINQNLDDLEEALNDSSRAADRLYGEARIKQMNKTSQLLEQEIDLLQQKKAAQEDIIADERAELDEVTGGNIKYDDQGRITNYDSYIKARKKQIEDYEAALREEGGGLSEEEANAVQEQIDLLNEEVEAMEDYEAALEEKEDIQNQIEDAYYEWQDLNAEKLSYKLELTLDVNDRELAEIERKINRLDGNFYTRAEALALMVGGGMNGNSQLAVYNKQLSDLESHYAEVKKAYEAGEISQADYIAQTKEIQAEIENTADAMANLQDQMDSYYKDTLAQARQELNYHISQLSHLTGILNHFKTTLTALGKSQDYEMMGAVLEGQVKTLENEVKVQKKAMEMWQGEADELYQKYQQELAAGNQENANMYYNAYKEALSAANEAENKFYQQSAAWANALKALMENTLAGLAQDLENALTGGTSFDTITTSLKRASSLQEEYLTTTNKIYETTKLMRNAQNEIDKTTNSVAKKKFANFITETKQMQNQNKLSKYELSIQQAKYDLLLAEIALEEARFAKNTVRLSRDSEGNFGYIYTADAEAINNAEQEFEDAQNKLYNIGLEGANKYTEKYQQTLAEMYNTLTSLQTKYLQGGFESEEEYNAAVIEAKEYYYEKLSQYSDLYAVSLTADSRVAADAWSTDFADMTKNTENWMNAVTDYLSKVREAFAEWERESDRIANETVGTNLTDLKNKVNDIVTESDNLVVAIGDKNSGVIKAIYDEITAVKQLTDEYASLNGQITNAIDNANDLSNQLQEDINQAQQEIPDSNIAPGEDESSEYNPMVPEETEPLPDIPLPEEPKEPDDNQTGGEKEPEAPQPQPKPEPEPEQKQETPHTHSYGEWKVVAKASCTKDGKKERKCTCGDVKTETIPKTGHKAGSAWKYDKEYHWHVCTECGTIMNKAKHTIKDGKCSVCGYKPDSKSNGILEVGDTPIYKSGRYYSDSYGGSPSGNRGPGKRVKVTQVIKNPKSGQDYPIHVESNDSAYGWLKASQLEGYDTGGYTGAWGPFGKLAMLHEKELILNKEDTENFLASLELLDSILSTIDLHAMNSQFNAMINSPYIPQFGKETLEQMVSIEANFPNVTDKQEIEDAFKNLVNLASQYANRK